MSGSSIYIASSSSLDESRRVAEHASILRTAGYGFVPHSEWWTQTAPLRASGIQDSDLMPSEAWEAAVHCRRAVIRSDAFWLQIPEATSIGCWTELGIATMVHGKLIISSGDARRSIFTKLAWQHFAEHADALRWLLEKAGVR